MCHVQTTAFLLIALRSHTLYVYTPSHTNQNTTFFARDRPSRPTMTSDNTVSKLNAPTSKYDTAHGFFTTIPRELRDQIYNLISQDKETLIRGPLCKTYVLRIRTTAQPSSDG